MRFTNRDTVFANEEEVYLTAYGFRTTRNILWRALELQVVGMHSIAESESGSKISDHDTILLHLSEDSRVYRLLFGYEFSGNGFLGRVIDMGVRYIPSSPTERKTQLQTSSRPSCKPWVS